MTAYMETPFTSTPDFETTPRKNGDFLSQSKNPVRETIVVGEDETPYANIRELIVRMKDGAYYKASEVLPKRRKVDVMNVRTPAWTTSHNKGYEKEYALGLAAIGVGNICFSPQQNRARIGNMHRSSHDYVEAALTRAHKNGFVTDHLNANGSSRGAMYARVMAAIAPKHGAHADTIESIGAALPKGIVAKDTPRALGRLAHEPLGLVRVVTHDIVNYTPILVDTVTHDLREMEQHGKELFTLIDGSTGRHGAKMPDETAGFDQQFGHDGLGFREHLGEVLDSFGQIHQRLSDGTHIYCVSPWILGQSLERQGHIRDGYMAGAVGSTALYNMVIYDNEAFQGGLVAARSAFDLAS